MRFSLKSLFIVVTLASVFMGAVAFWLSVSDKRSTSGHAALFVITCIPASLVGALIGKMFGKAAIGVALGTLAALAGIITFEMYLQTQY
jgi:hypothetical protein